MISLESIKGFFPEELRTAPFARHILKEYVEHLLFRHERAELVVRFPAFVDAL